MNNCGIYKITNKINWKFYIGSSKHLDRRWWEHQNDLLKHIHTNKKLQHAWNYYGIDSFEFTILEYVTSESLITREQYYLDMFKPYMREIGYNICEAAAGGDTFTNNPNKEKLRKHFSDINILYNNPMRGKKHSPESIKKQKEMSIGRYTLEWFIDRYGNDIGTLKYKERNEKLKDRKINYVYDNGMKGVVRGEPSQEIKDKISKNKIEFKKNRVQFLIDLSSNQYTIKSLAKKYNVSSAAIKYHKRKIK